MTERLSFVPAPGFSEVCHIYYHEKIGTVNFDKWGNHDENLLNRVVLKMVK